MGIPSLRSRVFSGARRLSALIISLIIGFAMTGQAPEIRLFAALLLLIPVSQLSIEVVNYFVTRFLPARSLPKMDFKDSGIPDEFRTLVVVPMMMVDAETIQRRGGEAGNSLPGQQGRQSALQPVHGLHRFASGTA